MLFLSRSCQNRFMMKWKICLCVLLLWNNPGIAQKLSLEKLESLPVETGGNVGGKPDWLITPQAYQAGVYKSTNGKELVLSNGLVRRAFRLSPNAATVALDNLYSGEAFLRAAGPEAVLQINGVKYEVGGLTGQPNHAYLSEEWLDSLKSDPLAIEFTDFEVTEIEERFPWKRVRHCAPDVQWPPKGVGLRMDYRLPDGVSVKTLLKEGVQSSELGRRCLLSDDLLTWNDCWKLHVSSSHPRSSFTNEGKAGEIYTPANSCVFAEAELPAGTRIVEADFEAGTDLSRAYGPGIAMIWPDRTIKLQLSPGGDGYNPYLTIAYFNGKKWVRRFEGAGKFDASLTYTLRIRVEDENIFLDIRPRGESWRNLGVLKQEKVLGDPQKVRIGKMDAQGGDQDDKKVGEPVRTTVRNFRAYSGIDSQVLEASEKEQQNLKELRVSVHYELYDGIPAYAKWVTVTNGGRQTVTIDRFLSEILAAVEYTSRVEERGVYYPTPNMHVETDYAFGGFDVACAAQSSVRWTTDPAYTTQVMGMLTTPCLLEVGPKVGPMQDVAPGQTFSTFVTYVIPFDSYERERNGLAQRRLYRTVAPWTTENPLMMHLKSSDWESVRMAIDQCAEVGFEMVIMSFGSGFNIEDTTAANLKKMKEYADYAHAKGIDIGGYSLLSSRSARPASDNVVSPPGQKPTHGVMPALASRWGQEYMQKLYRFFEKTGHTIFEHDGSYPGDFDMTPRPPLQKGGDDSQWVQWQIISDFYKWCKGQGVFLNIPDYYFLVGGNKIGMGYREVNWSLPRAQQLIHTRQNIYDGTWEKTPSMGWMHVPLTMYHGGGAAATIEPLCEHLDHYRTIMASNLGAGVQAVYRGKRLYDTPETRDMVKGMVEWYKRHRDILESDIIHLRRPDGRQPDYYLHANPALAEKGLLMVFNPTDQPVEKTIRVPLYYTGLRRQAYVSEKEGKYRKIKLDDEHQAVLRVTLPAAGYSYFIFK